jgi:guanine deaminase
MKIDHEHWMRRAIELAIDNARSGRGGPFAAVVIKDNQLVASGVNQVTASNDPTAHAEVVAIRQACHTLGSFQLTGCEVYTSCEPCPMCLGALYWARPERFYFAASRATAAAAGFDDAFIYDQISMPPEARSLSGHCVLEQEGAEPFRAWAQTIEKTVY